MNANAMRRRLDKLDPKSGRSRATREQMDEQLARYQAFRDTAHRLCSAAGLNWIELTHRYADGVSSPEDLAVLDQFPDEVIEASGSSLDAWVRAWSWMEREF